jgi:hypothetical protein
MIKPYYSKEQAEALHRLRHAAGGAAFDQAWSDLMADIRADMESGGGPESEGARAGAALEGIGWSVYARETLTLSGCCTQPQTNSPPNARFRVPAFPMWSTTCDRC